MGKDRHAAVVNGLGNADKLIKRIQSGEVSQTSWRSWPAAGAVSRRRPAGRRWSLDLEGPRQGPV